MDSSDFWSKKRLQLQQQGKLPQPRQEPVKTSGPWWADEPTQPATKESGMVTGVVEGTAHLIEQQEHDFSKAMHLKDKSGHCPNCTSGNFMNTSASYAARCFDCGYTQGRELNDLDVFALSPDAQTINVKQTRSAQGKREGTSLADINAANAVLERSAQGKATIE